MLNQLRRRKWNWLRHTLRRNDDSIAIQALQWTPPSHGGRGGRPKNLVKKEIWRNVDGRFKNSWEKMAAAQDIAGWRQVVSGLCSTGSDKA